MHSSAVTLTQFELYDQPFPVFFSVYNHLLCIFRASTWCCRTKFHLQVCSDVSCISTADFPSFISISCNFLWFNLYCYMFHVLNVLLHITWYFIQIKLLLLLFLLSLGLHNLMHSNFSPYINYTHQCMISHYIILPLYLKCLLTFPYFTEGRKGKWGQESCCGLFTCNVLWPISELSSLCSHSGPTDRSDTLSDRNQ